MTTSGWCNLCECPSTIRVDQPSGDTVAAFRVEHVQVFELSDQPVLQSEGRRGDGEAGRLHTGEGQQNEHLWRINQRCRVRPDLVGRGVEPLLPIEANGRLLEARRSRGVVSNRDLLHTGCNRGGPPATPPAGLPIDETRRVVPAQRATTVAPVVGAGE